MISKNKFLLAFRRNGETSLQDPTNKGRRRPSHQHENCKREKILQRQQVEFGILEELVELWLGDSITK